VEYVYGVSLLSESMDRVHGHFLFKTFKKRLSYKVMIVKILVGEKQFRISGTFFW